MHSLLSSLSSLFETVFCTLVVLFGELLVVAAAVVGGGVVGVVCGGGGGVVVGVRVLQASIRLGSSRW